MDETYSSGYSNLSYLDVEQRRFDLAGELLALSLPITVERDLPICRVWQTGSRGRLHLLEGRWAEAVADADAVLSAPSAPLARTWPHLARGLVALRSGGDADADLDEAWRLACRFGEPIRLLPAVAALAERAWLLGTEDERLADAVALLDRYPPVGLEWARGELAVWLRRLDPGAGSRPVIVGVAEPFQAELDGDPWTAAARWEAIGAPYERALALIATGRDDHRRDGLDILDRLGAERVAAKVRRDLRERGVATVPAPRRASTQANAAGLTRRQLDVLRLMGEGLTNAELAERLYISAKTVDHHVSAILTRLQVTGRRDAVRQARRLGVLD
jgi:DNA-binding CsgD family transcriptional regulator